MGLSLKAKYHDKYSETLIKLLADPYKEDLKSFTGKTYNIFENDYDIIQLKIDQHLNKYFRCVNGFLGNDYLLLKHTAFDVMLFANLINEDFNEEYEQRRQNEIKIHFYLFLNCVYNIKEKYMSFIGCSNQGKKLLFDKSVLSEYGITEIDKMFKETNNDIYRYCEARNEIVHETYEIEYNPINEIIVKTFRFNLKDVKEDDVKTRFHKFIISNKEILELMNSLFLLRYKFYMLLSDSNSIDVKKFQNKYYENGTIKMFFP